MPWVRTSNGGPRENKAMAKYEKALKKNDLIRAADMRRKAERLAKKGK